MDIGALLRRAREEAELSQRQLAVRAGVTASTVSRYETGAQVPSLALLDRLLEACGRDVRFVLTTRHADLDAEMTTLAELPWDRRVDRGEPGRSLFLRRLAKAPVDVLVAGQWAAALHGLPTEPADGRLLVPQRDIAELARCFMTGPVPWREIEGHFGSVPVRESTFVHFPRARWYLPLTGAFTTEVITDGSTWPDEQRLQTDAGDLRVLASAELTPEDGVEPSVLERWRARRVADRPQEPSSAAG